MSLAKNQTNCNNPSMQRKITQRADDNTRRVFQKRGKTRGNKVFMLVLLSQNVWRVSFISTFFCIFRIFLSKITLTSAIPNHKLLYFSLTRLWISHFFFKVRLASRDLTNICFLFSLKVGMILPLLSCFCEILSTHTFSLYSAFTSSSTWT